MTYEEAQSKIDDTRLQDELSRNLRRMNEAAKALRQRRTDRGALSLASPEVKFKIDTETHDPLDVGMYQVSPFCTNFSCGIFVTCKHNAFMRHCPIP